MTAVRVSCLVTVIVAAGAIASDEKELRRRVFDLEQRRIEVVERIAPACVCLSADPDSGGGSGVLIDADGYGLTNYHVVASMMGSRSGYGGLNDGEQYRLEVLGVDITGDVAMFRLVGRDRFPFAELGESAAVAMGDPVIALGNPFSLALDFQPTVTTGIVTGVHRYQGESDTLVYTDCIQTDASINPGNSGGPLFDADGRVIGINGRISAEMHKYARGRFNVGLGYAISIDQIKRFIPHLRAGLLGKHGTLLATVTDDGDRVVFDDMYENAPAWDAGIRVGDRLVRFGNENLRSANHFTSLLGTYPGDWPVPVTFESRRGVVHKLIRLESVTPPMKREFAVSGKVNREAVRRVLEGFRRAIPQKPKTEGRKPKTEGRKPKGGGTEAKAKNGQRTTGLWSWMAVRTAEDGRRTEFRVTDAGETEASELNDGGEVVRKIVAGDEGVKVVRDGREDEAGIEEALVYTAMHELRHKLLGDETFWESPSVEHAGGDALVEMNESGRVTRTRALETIGWSVSEGVSARVGFELDSQLPARVVVRDAPSDVTVEIELSDYRRTDGVRWPHAMRVRGPKLRFDEVIAELEVTW